MLRSMRQILRKSTQDLRRRASCMPLARKKHAFGARHHRYGLGAV
jgi:hypothetical protein